jgi:hypothetical protein
MTTATKSNPNRENTMAAYRTAYGKTAAPRNEVPEVTMMQLLQEALNAPGKLGNTYSRFYEYSFMNCLWLMVQGVNEPVGPYGFWRNKFGRQVMKGQKAHTVLHPVFITKTDKETKKPVLDKQGRKQMILVAFKPKATVFGYSQTDGPEIEMPELPTWNLEMALAALEIEQEPFAHLDGNTQGYSYDHKLAINPVAVHPMKTMFHELAHIVLGHTTDTEHTEHDKRGIKEFQAEAVAYLLANELELVEWDASESRAYIQTWLSGTGSNDDITDSQIRSIFGAVNKILKAGRPARTNEE